MNPADIARYFKPIPCAPALKRLLLYGLLLLHAGSLFSQTRDSGAVLKTIEIGVIKKQNDFISIAPIQSLNRQTLQQINAQSVGDAARYFSGVLIKDYGGIGGLKTISVRSLGASNTSIIYDGMPVSDLQTGQVDLSRFSTTFLQSLELQQGTLRPTLQPARAYAPAAALIITTNTFDAINFNQQNWQAGINGGSFAFLQPFAGIYQPIKKNAVISINAEALYSKGDYPVKIDNGNFSSKTNRNNADIKSVHGEVNLLKQFKDSATLQLKAGSYNSARGLPGAIVFFNDRSVQRLWNTDFFIQGRYHKKISAATALLGAAKFSNTYTRYSDPDYLNNQGGIDNRYKQQEFYISFAANHYLRKNLLLSAASDMAWNKLTADLAHFANPRRISFWENIALNYTASRWQLNTSLLYTGIHDKTATGTASGNKNKFTPAIAIGIMPADASPLLFRFFYKSIYRMPTFNDLYYNLIGAVSLKPEYAAQYNAGITYSRQFKSAIKKFSISADAYYNNVKDKIIAVPNKNLFVWTMLNLGRVSIKGLDINTEAKGSLFVSTGWFARIAYTWQRAADISDKSSSSYKNDVPYTPNHSGSGLVSFNYKKWEAGYGLLFSGARYTLGENNPANRLPGWLTHDVFVLRHLQLQNVQILLKAAMDNITDKRFDVVRYFPMPGRLYKISFLINK